MAYKASHGKKTKKTSGAAIVIHFSTDAVKLKNDMMFHYFVFVFVSNTYSAHYALEIITLFVFLALFMKTKKGHSFSSQMSKRKRKRRYIHGPQDDPDQDSDRA